VATDLLKCHEDSDDYQQEFRLLSHAVGKWNWLAGAMAYHGKDDFDSIIDALGHIGSAGIQTVKTNAWAVYGEVGYDFTEKWTLRLGGRWSSERKQVDLVHSSAPLAFAPVPYHDSAHWSDFTPSATLQYKTQIGMLYARYADGFKSGGFNYPSGVTNPPVNPEKIKSYEIGLKSDLLDRRLRLNTSAFYYDFKDLQVQLVNSTGGVAVVVTTQNAATAIIKGGETELTWIPVDRLTVSSGIAFVDGKYSKYRNAALNIPNAVGPGWSGAPNCCDVSGERLVLTSKWTASTDVGYEFPLGQARLPTSLSYSWRSDYDEELIHLASREGARQPSYGLLDARVSYIPSQDSRLTVSLWGNNLTDKIYFLNRTLSTRGQYNTYAPPRTYGMDVTYKF
jgi:iron complex outermembrane receptor protein